jgi:hypothetical protein
MDRYSVAQIVKTPEDPKRRYTNIRYPSISPSSTDIYLYTGQGDRYDTLALTYYSDTTLWWVISRANPSQPNDTLYPNVGAQIRIPNSSRIPNIIASFQNLNNLPIQ